MHLFTPDFFFLATFWQKKKHLLHSTVFPRGLTYSKSIQDTRDRAVNLYKKTPLPPYRKNSCLQRIGKALPYVCYAKGIGNFFFPHSSKRPDLILKYFRQISINALVIPTRAEGMPMHRCERNVSSRESAWARSFLTRMEQREVKRDKSVGKQLQINILHYANLHQPWLQSFCSAVKC